MSEFLYHYHPVEPATWFYLSSLLTIGLFFKFSRLWSVRNLDLLLLILLAPGLLFVHYGRKLDDQSASDGAGYERYDEGLVQGVANPATEGVPGESATNGPGVLPASPPNVTAPNVADSATKNSTDDEAAVATDTGAQPATSDLPADLAESELDEAGVAENASGQAAAVDPAAPRSRGKRFQKYGYLWLFGMGAILLARLLADPTMVRRPLLEPNLSAGGLTFIGCSLFVFLMANVISRPAEVAAAEPQSQGTDVGDASENAGKNLADGPGHASIFDLTSSERKTLAIIAHIAIVIGMVLVGYWHFDNILMGIGAAALYLMLPYNALMTNEVRHVLPAACLVWSVLCYRRPVAAGCFLGLAGGMAYYPLFLLPLWFSFYWPRGLLRFSIGVAVSLIVLLFVLYFQSDDLVMNIRLMFGLIPPATEGLRGIWDSSLGGWNTHYRYPVLAAFLGLSISMALWPAQKNLGTLLSCSAAVMIATQFWHGYGGGMYMAWYLPLLLLTVFRPNLEDRVAVMVVSETWLPKRFSRDVIAKAA